MTTLLGDEVGAPASLVDAPPAAPPLVSLLTSAVVEDGPDGEWENGVAYLPECTAEPTLPYWWDCQETGGAAPTEGKAVGDNADAVRFRAFTILDGLKCSMMSWNAEEWQARAKRQLLSRQSTYIERELWGGDVATLASFPNDFLTNSPTIVGGAALGYARALAELEQAAADAYDGRPATIHARPRLVSLWTQNDLVTPSASGRQLRTQLGTLVVPGAGYDGSGPTLATDTVAATYAYITGIVHVRLGPIRELSIENDGTVRDAEFSVPLNDFTVRMERPAVYWFDPCLKHGVLVNLTSAL